MQHLYAVNKLRFNYAVLFCICLFILNETTREFFQSKLAILNMAFLFLGVLFLLKSISKGNFNRTLFFIGVFLSCLLVVGGFFIFEHSPLQMSWTFINIILPILILSVYMDFNETINGLGKFLQLFNVFVMVLFVMGVVDFITNGSIQLYLASTIYTSNGLGQLIRYEHYMGIYRYYSIAGHPLTNAKFFLLFLILNNIYGGYIKFLINRYILIIISLTGILLSGSKTALMLALIIIVFGTKPNKYKLLYYTLIISVFLILFNTSLFQNNLAKRFIEGIATGDISTGRNELLARLMNSDMAPLPKFFFGEGLDYSRYVAGLLHNYIGNFEYPIIMFAYDYGILITILIYICVFLYPATVLLKNKDYKLFFYFLVISIMMNSNNGIANVNGDTLSQFCIILLFFMNISTTKRRKYVEKL